MKHSLMKISLMSLVLGAIVAFGLVPTMAKDDKEVHTVSHVDLNRYMGKWYEIASIPMFFQRDCVANTTAEYTLLPDGLVKVFNSCETKNGTRKSANARAKSEDPASNAKLKVTFVKLFGWRFIAGGQYWILGLNDDYSDALIGQPDRKYGWILSRTPNLGKERLRELAAQFTAQGYDTCRFIMTPQTGGHQKSEPLCEVVK